MQRVFITACLILLAAMTGVAGDWREVKDTFEDKITSSKSEERIGALNLVAGMNDHKMVKAVLKAMVNETDNEVLDAAAAALAKISDKGTFKHVVSEIKKSLNNRSLTRVIFRALSASSLEIAREELVDAVKKKSNPPLMIAAMENMVSLPPRGELWDAVKKNLEHKVREVRIAAVQAIAACDDEAIGMETLINHLPNADGRIKQDINVILKRKLGTQGYDSPEMWLNALQEWRARERGQDPPANGTVFEEPDIPTYFGVPILSKNVVLVIDRTHSMTQEIDPRIIEEMKKREKKEETIESNGGDAEAKKEEEEKDKNDDLPWDKIKTKWDLAREEAKRAINALPEDIYFNVVYYNLEFTAIENKMVPATPANKRKMISALDGLVAESVTDAFFDALREGMKYTRQGKQEPDAVVYTDHPMKESVDTIMFLTDGFPTHGADGTKMPDDMAREHLEKFLKNDWPKKKPVVNAIGIGPHARWLMQQLAEETGGEYVDLSMSGPVRRR
jgi:RNA-binding protein YhbY